MDKEQALELHVLLFTFMGHFHEKFLVNYRQQLDSVLPLKKNQTKIVSLLYHYDGLTPTELARMLDIEKGGLTTIIDQLEELGLVVRCPDSHDRRKQLLKLSDHGRQAMERVMQRYTDSLILEFANVSEQEWAEFVDSLRYVVNFMEKN